MLILGIVLAFALIAGMVYLFETRIVSRTTTTTTTVVLTPTPALTATPGPSPTGSPALSGGTAAPPAPSPAGTSALPSGWAYGYDGMLQYEFAYPQGWDFHPATSTTDESALYSFSTDATVAGSGIPADQLKIAVLFYPSGGSGSLGFDPNNVVSSNPVTIGGYPAVRRVLNTPGGGSVATTVTVTGDTFIATASPGDSMQIGVYDEFLNHLRPELNSPVSVVEPMPGQAVAPPLQVSGQAPSGWMPDGQLPVKLTTEGGAVIAQATATTTQDATSGTPLPFTATLDYLPPYSPNGVLVITRGNPPGLPLNSYTYFLPVSFDPPGM